jgi:predicted transcriptional regulator of viral defense system
METQLLSYCQAREVHKLVAGEAARALQWTPEQERKVLSQLARKGLAFRLRRGLYLLPSRLPIDGRWNPSEMMSLTTLMAESNGQYQITGPHVFHRYGWTEQISNRIYAYNNRLSGNRQIGAVALTWIKVNDSRLGATEVVRTPEGIDVRYSSKARAMVDAVYDWARFDTLPLAYRWIAQEIEADEGFAGELVRTAVEFGNQGTLRRLGAALEKFEIQQALLRRLERELRPSAAMIPMVPRQPKRGTGSHGRKTNKRWGVVNNDE